MEFYLVFHTRWNTHNVLGRKRFLGLQRLIAAFKLISSYFVKALLKTSSNASSSNFPKNHFTKVIYHFDFQLYKNLSHILKVSTHLNVKRLLNGVANKMRSTNSILFIVKRDSPAYMQICFFKLYSIVYFKINT